MSAIYTVAETLECDPVNQDAIWVYTVVFDGEWIAQYPSKFLADRHMRRLNSDLARRTA